MELRFVLERQTASNPDTRQNFKEIIVPFYPRVVMSSNNFYCWYSFKMFLLLYIF